MKDKRSFSVKPHLELLAVQIIFGTWGIAGKIALREITPFALSAIRVALAAAAFALIGQLTGNIKPIARRDWPLLFASSVCGIVLNQWFFVTGLSHTTVINSVLITTTMPIFTLIIGSIAGTDRPSFGRALGIVLAAAGVFYLIGPSRADVAAGSRLGDLFILGSALIYGCYIAISKPLVEKYGALPTVTWIFIIATLPTVVVGAISLRQVSVVVIDARAWLSIAYIVAVPTVVAYYLLSAALKEVAPSTVAVYIYLQPLIAFLAAPALLGEAFTMRTAIAAALVFAGVGITTRRRKQRSVQMAEIEIT
ncbi:MAG TPA: DMT family transporter, partial [Pyrinomonadaceae bacterium]|nr:DMT family transporter [Pyrinomonadaceae bacterium]